ncbi:MAG: acetoacetate decarboxylase family protein [Methanocorpusculum sp.]|nr:acetoacetate decarboxylase family protein [Methanocorpusculum sp.]
MFTFDNNLRYGMPPHFGGFPYTYSYGNIVYEDCTCLMMNYTTERDILEQYIPDVFELLKPEVSVSSNSAHGVGWMGGGHYSCIALTAPVKHIKTGTEGAYMLILWEDSAYPILGGREDTGMPKVFCDIGEYAKFEDHASLCGSYNGRNFIDLEIHIQKDLTAEEVAAAGVMHLNQIGWRYIGNFRKPGAAISEPTIYPVEMYPTAISTGVGKVTWTKLTYQQYPMQAHMIDALANIPILEYAGPATYMKYKQILRGDLARVLE